MKKRTRIMVMILLSLGLVLAACGNKYGDAKDILQKQADIFEKYINAMDNVKNSDDLVTTINTFTTDMSEMIPRLQSLSEKYPDLEKNDEPPVELKDEIAKIEALSEKMSGAIMKNIQYMGDPKVQKAMQEQGRILNESLTK